MKKVKVNVVILVGIVCVLFSLASIWYANTFNEGRLVAPMDISIYEFQMKDIPMIISIITLGLYVVGLFCLMMTTAIRKRKKERQAVRTRQLNPKLGLLGLLGLLGFTGFWTYSVDKTFFPFCFFIFFGFFGFFFEGKMSGTFMDERFRENARKAELTSLKTGFSMMWIVLFSLGLGKLHISMEYVAIVLLIAISLIMGFTMFLTEYLLYRYDHDDQSEE